MKPVSSETFDWVQVYREGLAEEEAKRKRYEERVTVLHGDPVERWLSRYPSGNLQKKLLGELKKGHHEGASFELMLHALLLAQGFDVTVNPRQPDFHVVSPRGEEFDIEATSVMTNPDDHALSNAATDLSKCLNGAGIEHEGLVVTATIKRFEGSTPCRRIQRTVESAVDRRKSVTFDGNRWIVEIEVNPCEPGKFCDDKHIVINWTSGGATPDVYLRRKIKDKISISRTDVPGDVPYIVAVNIEDHWWGDSEYDDLSVLSAFILGSPQIRIPIHLRDGGPPDDFEPEIEYPFDAAVTRDGRKPVHQRVSGLWAFSDSDWLKHSLRSQSALRFPRYACYYPNPWAQNPLENPFPRMRHCILRQGENPFWPNESASIGEVLGLPYGWPRSEQDG